MSTMEHAPRPDREPPREPPRSPLPMMLTPFELWAVLVTATAIMTVSMLNAFVVRS